MLEESIYSIIQEKYVPLKQKFSYKSIYPPTIPPTASTFCTKTTAQPNVANMKGDIQRPKLAHQNMGATSTFYRLDTFGRTKQELIQKPQDFLRKKPLSARNTDKFNYPGERRPDVPSKDQRPLMNLQSNKNFVVLNAVENILSGNILRLEPKQQDQNPNYLQKKDYGKIPKYLSQIKDNIQGEYQMIQTMNDQQQLDQERQRILLSETEVQQLKAGLKKKWDELNLKYQQLTHKFIDTIGLKRAKMTCEKELLQIEKDLEKLNKQYIFVDNS